MKLLILCILFSCLVVTGQDFLYGLEYQPDIHSRINQSFNEDPVQFSMMYNENSYDAKGTEFALSSVKIAKRSIMRYLSPSDTEGIMFRYTPKYPEQDLMIRILGGFDYNQNSNEHYFFVYKGLRLQSQITKNISINGYWWAGQFRGDKNYYNKSPLIDGYYQPDKEVVYLDNLQGSLRYDVSNVHVSLGRGKFQEGDNISGSIILNNAANDYGYLSGQLEFGTLSLSYLHCALTPDSSEVVYYQPDGPGSVDSYRVDKFLVMHKLDWNPRTNFMGFLGEEIVYGNRSLDLNYLIPPVFWRIIEHNLEDRDNVLIFGGLKWGITPHITFYQNTLFDEYTQSKILTDWWGSKYAVQAGLSYQFHNRFTNQDDDLISRVTMEATAVRPWTYTHFIKWNKFSNDNIAMGYPVGSNCINYSFETDYPITNRIFIAVNASYSRQGSEGNKFDLNTADPLVIPDQLHTKTRWLAGTIADTKRLKIMAEWKPLAHHFIRLGTTLSQINEMDWTKDLTLSYRTEF